MKKKREPPTQCAFCPNNANSRERVFPKWLKPYVPAGGGNNAHTGSWGGRIAETTAEFECVGRGKLHRPGSSFSQRLRCVCKRCNNEWMGNLQELAKPILIPFLKGQWPEIPPECHATLAAWATMATMVIEFAHLETMASTPVCRAALKRTGLPPSDWFVFVGRYFGDGVWNRGAFNHFGITSPGLKLVERNGLLLIPPATALAPRYDSQSTAFACSSAADLADDRVAAAL